MTISKTTPSELIGQSLTEYWLDKAFDIRYKHVGVVIVWKEDLDSVAYYMLFTRKTGKCLGHVKHSDYLNGKL